MNKRIKVILLHLIIICFIFQPLVNAYHTSDNKSLNDDAPAWDIGDSWSYKINDILIEYEYADKIQEVQLDLNIVTDDLNMEVLDNAGDTYKLHFEIKLNGQINIAFSKGNGTYEFAINLGRFTSTKVQGEIICNKTNLGIERINVELSGILQIKISQQPLIKFPIPPLLIPIKIELNFEFNTPYAMLEFPLYIEKYWNNPINTLILQDGTISSPWLRPLNFIHNIIRLLGVVPDDFKDLSDKIAEILPIIRIRNLLDTLSLNDNIYLYPMGFECIGYEEIETTLGNFETYNISIIGDSYSYGTMYYSPVEGKIIKLSLDGFIIFYFIKRILSNYIELPAYIEFPDINIELIKTDH